MITVAINNPYLPTGGWQCCLEITVNMTGTEYNISGFFDKAGLLTENDCYRRVCEPGKDTKWLLDCQIVDGGMNGVFPDLSHAVGGNRIMEMLREIGTEHLLEVADRDCAKYWPTPEDGGPDADERLTAPQTTQSHNWVEKDFDR